MDITIDGFHSWMWKVIVNSYISMLPIIDFVIITAGGFHSWISSKKILVDHPMHYAAIPLQKWKLRIQARSPPQHPFSCIIIISDKIFG